MSIRDYYQEELNALRIEGRQLVEENPGLAPYLGEKGQDPDVERLLEGFAFLTGKLRTRLDEELPELSHSLVQLLWPHYLRSIPSSCIIQFQPIRKNPLNITAERNIEVYAPAKPEHPRCTFRLVYPTTVMPFELDRVIYNTQGTKGVLELYLNMSVPGSLHDISFETVRFYLGDGGDPVASLLYYYLMHTVEQVEFTIQSDREDPYTIKKGPEVVAPVGFKNDESMIPYPRNVFDGYRFIQEYFCFRNKFMFFNLNDLDVVSRYVPESTLSSSRSFCVRFYLSKAIPPGLAPTKRNFLLYCTPAINLYEAEAVPIHFDAERDEYLVKPNNSDEESEVFLLETVSGWIEKKKRNGLYHHFESFEHEGGVPPDIYYSTRIKMSPDGKNTQTFIRFSTPEGFAYAPLEGKNTVSMKLLATNGNSPRQIGLGEIKVASEVLDTSLEFGNINACTYSYPPPFENNFLWRIISNMSLSYLSLSNINAVRTILLNYDFIGTFDNRKKVHNKNCINEGLLAITNTRVDRLWRGSQIRGIHSTLRIDSSRFISIGEACLLGSVLNEFFALYCNVNSFHQLTMVSEKDEEFSWEPRMGTQVVF